MKTYYKLNLFFLLFFLTIQVSAQKELLQSGPMLGFTDYRESTFWVQTKKPAEVKINYWDKEKPGTKFSTNEVSTEKYTAFTAHLIADNVEPGKHYSYELLINGKKIDLPYPLEFQTLKLWQWREDAPDFNFVIGSCAYINEAQYDRPGKPYGSDYEIFTSIFKKRPDFMIWMGDNVYYREPDWNTRTGMLKRYTHSRSLPELQPLLASTHHYAIWDDHDYGPNNSDRGWVVKDTSLAAFKLFWSNPSYGINGKPGVTTRFEWGDVEFFLLDDRYYRAPDNRVTGDRVMFGDDQIQWLIDGMVNSNAVFKIIVSGGQLLNPHVDEETFSRYPEERDKLLDLIKKENIKGVVFFSGDIHSADLTKMDREGTYPLYDFTISSFTAGIYKPKVETNNWSVPGHRSFEHNFGYFTVTGPHNNRVLTCTDINYAGKELWKFSINENDLK